MGKGHVGDPGFYLFGMGDRPKMLYRSGRLLDAMTRQTIARLPVRSERIMPAEYRVEWTATDGSSGAIFEDDSGVWLRHGPDLRPLAQSSLSLPRFEASPHAATLRVLHHELLINIVAGRPLPSLFVYPRPWLRDGAMVAMALERTGNAPLLADWIGSLRDPFDRNNAGHREPDNLGQTLYLVSLASSAAHPVVEAVLAAAEGVRRGDHIAGITDGQEHPVYQTKWLKFGLAALKLDDPFDIPEIADPYSSLFWMACRDRHVPAGRFDRRRRRRYPYLAWAEAHFHRDAPPMELLGAGYPMTWESSASEADYPAMAWVSQDLAGRRTCMPHSWHAAEAFLYLIEAD